MISRPHRDTRQQVLDAINGLGPEYSHIRDQALALMDQRYSPTFGDSIARAFGSTAAEDRFYNEQETAAMELVSSAKDTKRVQDYNSSAAMAEREKAAGLNPDLVGTSSDAAGDAAAMPADITPADPYGGQSQDNPLGIISQISALVPGVGDILGSAVTLMNGVQAIRGQYLANDMAELENFFSLLPQAASALAGLEGPSNAVDGAGNPLQESGVSADMRGLMSSSAAKRLKRLFGAVTYSKEGTPTTALRNARAKVLQDYAASGNDIGETMGKTPGFSEDINTWMENYMVSLGNLQNTTLKLQQKALQAISEYDARTHSSENAETAAQANQALDQYKVDLYGSTDAEGNRLGQVESREKFVQSVQQRYASEIAKATDEFFAKQLESTKDPALRCSIIERWNEWKASLAQEQAAQIALGKKTIGQTDILTAGVNVGGDLLNLIPGKTLVSTLFKNKKHKKP